MVSNGVALTLEFAPDSAIGFLRPNLGNDINADIPAVQPIGFCLVIEQPSILIV